jgi:putative transcriptional regulator
MVISYNRLWKLLIDLNIKKMQLCEISGISTNAMAKLGKGESVQLDVLVKICEALHCKIEDIVEIKIKEENENV